MRRLICVLGIITVLGGCSNAGSATGKVRFEQGNKEVRAMLDGRHFTSYRYDADFTKPILYPVRTPSGVVVNRSGPLMPLEGETTDHPHHVGIFFTYDEVNDSGFWNNTTYPPQVKHVKVTKMAGGESGRLSTVMHWTDESGAVLLEEKRTMTFHSGDDEYAIDFDIDLTAREKVEFGDTKEGMFAIRVADWLSEKHGDGRYLSSNGDETEKDVWGKRAAWVRLQGEKDGKVVGIAIMNHPSSINYPTFWHARGYGLFAANPLGQYAFEKGRKKDNPTTFGLELRPGEKAHFAFRMVIYDGQRTQDQLQQAFKKFAR